MNEPVSKEERARRGQQRIQLQLHDALAQRAPASDPVSIVTSQAEESWDTAATPGPATDKVPPTP